MKRFAKKTHLLIFKPFVYKLTGFSSFRHPFLLVQTSSVACVKNTLPLTNKIKNLASVFILLLIHIIDRLGMNKNIEKHQQITFECRMTYYCYDF